MIYHYEYTHHIIHNTKVKIPRPFSVVRDFEDSRQVTTAAFFKLYPKGL